MKNEVSRHELKRDRMALARGRNQKTGLDANAHSYVVLGCEVRFYNLFSCFESLHLTLDGHIARPTPTVNLFFEEGY